MSYQTSINGEPRFCKSTTVIEYTETSTLYLSLKHLKIELQNQLLVINNINLNQNIC